MHLHLGVQKAQWDARNQVVALWRRCRVLRAIQRERRRSKQPIEGTTARPDHDPAARARSFFFESARFCLEDQLACYPRFEEREAHGEPTIRRLGTKSSFE